MRLALAVSMFASMALIADPADDSNPFALKGIIVTNAAGYTAPYLAADGAGDPYVENQTAYVVMSFTFKGADDDIAAPDATYTIEVTSSTLDLAYGHITAKSQYLPDAGVINPTLLMLSGLLVSSFSVAKMTSADPLTFTFTPAAVLPMLKAWISTSYRSSL